MKGALVVGLVVVVLAGAGSAYLLLSSPSTSARPSSSVTSQPSSPTTVPSQTHNQSATSMQTTNSGPAVTVSALACVADSKTCTITLMNSGGTAVEATGCTLNGQPGMFAPATSPIPPGGSANVSCSPSAGGAIPIPRFHVEGFIQLSDGSSVRYSGNWA